MTGDGSKYAIETLAAVRAAKVVAVVTGIGSASVGDTTASTANSGLVQRIAVLQGSTVLLAELPLSTQGGAATVGGSLLKHTVRLGSPVEMAAWNVVASCCVVGDAAGQLHFVTASGALLFSQHIFAPPSAGGSVFGAMTFATRPQLQRDTPHDELVVASTEGALLRFSKLSIKGLEDAAIRSVLRALHWRSAGLPLTTLVCRNLQR